LALALKNVSAEKLTIRQNVAKTMCRFSGTTYFQYSVRLITL
jgi:hypothetical protein